MSDSLLQILPADKKSAEPVTDNTRFVSAPRGSGKVRAVSDEPLTFPGDAERDEPIKRRPEDEVQRELAINHQDDPPPGGAEGGDESPSADLPMGLPADDQAEVGSTDQHSDPDRLPEHRERKNQSRD
jgi:hypothetical protein